MQNMPLLAVSALTPACCTMSRDDQADMMPFTPTDEVQLTELVHRPSLKATHPPFDTRS